MILEDKKRFLIELTDDIHKNIKRRCLDRNITMRRWILTAIIERIKTEEGFEEYMKKISKAQSKYGNAQANSGDNVIRKITGQDLNDYNQYNNLKLVSLDTTGQRNIFIKWFNELVRKYWHRNTTPKE